MEKENFQRSSNRKLSDGALVESISPKFRAGVLGATGSVGQRFISLLTSHPWIEIVALGASEKSAGRPYKDACKWRLTSGRLPEDVRNMVVVDAIKEKCKFINECDIIFSALAPEVAWTVELDLAKAGLAVFSNAAVHRYARAVPILVPQVNPKHLDLVISQASYTKSGGYIVANSNCSTAAISIALAPLQRAFGIKKVMVASLQAVSGAGYPGIPFWDIHNNVIPFIKGEEEKIEIELKKILGTLESDINKNPVYIEAADMFVSAMCHRVPVLNGHTISLSIEFATCIPKETVVQQVREVYEQFVRDEKCQLPSLKRPSICLMEEEDEPQPRLHANEEFGMSLYIGRIRPCKVFDVKLVTLSHNTILGAAGGSISNAELAITTGLLR